MSLRQARRGNRRLCRRYKQLKKPEVIFNVALINGIYIQVTDEDVDRKSDMSSHAAESGIEFTDTVKPQAVELSLKGKLVHYEGYSQEAIAANNYIKAWISIVKKDGSVFESMTFERLNNEILAFDDNVTYVDTGAIQYLNANGEAVDVTNGSASVAQVKLEIKMYYGGTARIQNAYTEWVCFNIINKSTTGYNVQDYNADAAELSDIVLSNTYMGETGRIRTTFTNYDENSANAITPDISRDADWVIRQLTRMWQTGALLTFEGRNYLENFQIESFSTSHPNTTAGGADFTMTLREFRGAVNSYGVSDEIISELGMQQISNGGNTEVYYTTQSGDTVYNLVSAENAPYKNLTREGQTGTAEAWVIEKNPEAFSIPGDLTSLMAGKSILLGTR